MLFTPEPSHHDLTHEPKLLAHTLHSFLKKGV
ncbi:hypothetical protein PC116_g3627 [Phytophthora cactorum]|uniref:Uncharacterized protein n=1 Tax=Phytophthora cactorum TaxID=29920 RepID=A0A8T1LGS2_9STRA|nr:hypothetical protein PC114_g1997 [Phytophthora cactorum]KAG2953791.1 hypothetical protein PC117_g1755 [Phytophthora cactorum]KAG3038634.1 hypothetical protein PC119_g2744 [Phytophthora cactorum]KAG3191111.1 hypothetical protein C6341_g1385 [Phytophthora cactorum]KAG4058829.1 hypothetical protein PC123_g6220 [Phytophthora cactorum]